MDLIESEFIERAIVRGNLLFFRAADAINVIERCYETNKRILGIDSFKITENATQPVLEHSIDFSTTKRNDGSWVEAKKFIEDRINEHLVFEITYD